VVRVVVADEVTDELVKAVQRLLPQLSRSARSPSDAEVAEIVESGATTLLLARDDQGDGEGDIVGMLTLVTFRLPTGLRAWVEDVVVDESQRGQGTGEALTRAAVELAASRGAVTVDLTSRPSRESANRLYQRVGFELRDSKVYRIRLSGGD
jgi:ribosomal protein S18 acetylase RimI-like enzyme